ncbi:MAG: hypothetical protein A2X32_01940 [Elusimicrobia bacterium GWC2_64_44]|nr:MAG: hypothetical protein A2X32_01940 [Elusimicrobia bacterium GWC2_64_44]
MNFYWNAFGPVNLGLDLAITFTFFMLAFLNSRLQPAKTRLTVCRQALLGAVALWVMAGAYIGGIIGFSLIARMFWTLCTAAIPLLLAFFAARDRKALLLLPALLLLACKFYGEIYEPNNLEVRRATITVGGLKEPVKLAHISDLQTDGTGAMHAEVLRQVNGYEPEFIFFTGDVLNHPSLVPEIQAYLQGFKSRQGSFFVGGNVDGGLQLKEFFKSTGFVVLDGDYRKIKTRAGTLGIVGLGLGDYGDRRLLQKLLAGLGSTDATLLLSHVPDAMRTAAGLPVTALFSGHTHGGQVCLPWFGPVVTLSGVSRGIAAGGIHKSDGLYVIVSRGLGLEGQIAPRVRTFCSPQILLLELKPE